MLDYFINIVKCCHLSPWIFEHKWVNSWKNKLLKIFQNLVHQSLILKPFDIVWNFQKKSLCLTFRKEMKKGDEVILNHWGILWQHSLVRWLCELSRDESELTGDKKIERMELVVRKNSFKLFRTFHLLNWQM